MFKVTDGNGRHDDGNSNGDDHGRSKGGDACGGWLILEVLGRTSLY